MKDIIVKTKGGTGMDITVNGFKDIDVLGRTTDTVLI